jgi:thymidylate synthase ThyX
MHTINPSVTFIPTPIEDWKKTVCKAARVCYAADSGNDEALLLRLIRDRHVSPWAIQPISLSALTYKKLAKITTDSDIKTVLTQVALSEYFLIDRAKEHNVLRHQYKYIVSTTLRTIVEEAINVYPSDPVQVLKLVEDVIDTLSDFIYDDTSFQENPFLVFEVVSNIGCTRELNRHSSYDFYPVEQSTRFCNFSSNKFNKELPMNNPYWKSMPAEKVALIEDSWKRAVTSCEREYLFLKDKGIENDIARGVLPLDLNTKAIYNATKNHWLDVIAKRLEGVTGTPQGDIKQIAGWINDIINA